MDKLEELYKRRTTIELEDTANLLADFAQYLEAYKSSQEKGSKEATEADLTYDVFAKIARSPTKDEMSIKCILTNGAHGFKNKPSGINKKCIFHIVSFLHSKEISLIETQAAGIRNEELLHLIVEGHQYWQPLVCHQCDCVYKPG